MQISREEEGGGWEGSEKKETTPFRRQNGRGEAGEFQFHFREDAAPSTRLDSRRPFVCRFHTGGGGGAGVVYMIVIGVLLVSRALLFFFPLFFSPFRCNIDAGCGRIFDRFDSFDFV